MKREKLRRETLPVAMYAGGKWIFEGLTGDGVGKVTCSPYGQMSDGTLVWTDSNENQYVRRKLWGVFFFEKL